MDFYFCSCERATYETNKVSEKWQFLLVQLLDTQSERNLMLQVWDRVFWMYFLFHKDI